MSSNLLTTTTCVPEVFFYRLNKMENNSAGNTVSRRRAASGKLPFLMFCDKEILYHGFLCFTTIMVTVTQATVLNFFIIAFFRGYYHQVSFGKKKFFSIFLTLYFWPIFEKFGKVSKNFVKLNSSIQLYVHYSKSQIFVQKFNFDKTPLFSRVFHPNFFWQFFSWN